VNFTELCGVEVKSEVRDAIRILARDAVWDLLRSSVGDLLRDETWALVRNPVWDMVWLRVRVKGFTHVFR